MRKQITHLRRKIISLFAASALVMIGLVAFGATPAFAKGAGEMCMFNAPKGAPIAPVYSAGHVGWAFEVGNSGSWIYGSTEIGDGHPSSTWIQSGGWGNMLAAFKAHGGASYYTKYRCKATPDSSVGAASNAADLTKSNGYNGLFNNCLTKSVYIFNAYWVDPLAGALANGWAIPPNIYFNNLGPNYGWGQIVNF